MTRNGKLLSALAVSLLVLAACDGSDGDGGGTGSSDPQDLFGAQFAAAFNQTANDDPRPSDQLSVSYQGVDGVNLTADPVDL